MTSNGSMNKIEEIIKPLVNDNNEEELVMYVIDKIKDNLVKMVEGEKKEPPYKKEDFEEQDRNKLTMAAIRNAKKIVANSHEEDYRNGWNNAIDHIITKIKEA